MKFLICRKDGLEGYMGFSASIVHEGAALAIVQVAQPQDEDYTIGRLHSGLMFGGVPDCATLPEAIASLEQEEARRLEYDRRLAEGRARYEAEQHALANATPAQLRAQADQNALRGNG